MFTGKRIANPFEAFDFQVRLQEIKIIAPKKSEVFQQPTTPSDIQDLYSGLNCLHHMHFRHILSYLILFMHPISHL